MTDLTAMSDDEIYVMAEKAGNEITELAKRIASAYWVRTGNHLNTEDQMPEIVAAALYVIDKVKV